MGQTLAFERRRPATRRGRGARASSTKAAQTIADDIRAMVMRGELRDGDFLASQGELQAKYAVSRPTIREAFRILESDGLISIARGSRTGARILSPRLDTVARHARAMLQIQGTTLADVNEARRAIEPWAARLVARSGAANAAHELRGRISDCRAVIEDAEAFTAAVSAFHETLVMLSGNRTLSMLINIVRDITRRGTTRLLAANRAATGREAYRRGELAALRSFEKLVELIEQRDEDGAEAHWRAHIENANRTWLRAERASPPLDLLGPRREP
ncbi:MAG: FadR/GntR family transcriptional regulator [Gammaproteobacteria bacterium]